LKVKVLLLDCIVTVPGEAEDKADSASVSVEGLIRTYTEISSPSWPPGENNFLLFPAEEAAWLLWGVMRPFRGLVRPFKGLVRLLYVLVFMFDSLLRVLPVRLAMVLAFVRPRLGL
jgi:hypothetical protein